MKKYFMLLLILIINISAFSKSNDQYKKTEIKYTAADVLNARMKPSLNSEITVQLPYGTIVNVYNAGKKIIYNGTESSWYFCKEINAYLPGMFLSVSEPGENIHYACLKNDSTEGCPSNYATLVLQNMKARHIRKANCHGDITEEEREGIYKIKPGYIEISWGDYYSVISTIDDNKETEKKLHKGFTEKLYWNSKANGWLPEKTITAMKKYKCVPGKDDCFMDCSESCEALNNEKGCKNYSDWTEYIGTYFPYYCKGGRITQISSSESH